MIAALKYVLHNVLHVPYMRAFVCCVSCSESIAPFIYCYIAALIYIQGASLHIHIVMFSWNFFCIFLEVEFELPKVLIKVLFWALLKVLLLGKVLFEVLKKVL